MKVESGKLVLEEAEFDLGRELEGLVDMFSVQCINHNVETVLDLSGMHTNFLAEALSNWIIVFCTIVSAVKQCILFF